MLCFALLTNNRILNASTCGLVVLFLIKRVRKNESNKKKEEGRERERESERGPVNSAGPRVSICAQQEALLGGLFSWM